MTQMQWLFRPGSPEEEVRTLAESLKTSQVFPLPIAQILLQRNISDFLAARSYFKPDLSEIHDPYLLCDMDKAVERILLARSNNEKILLFGDYDVDGTTAVTLLSLFFEKWGFDFDYYIPDRYGEGYGVSYKGIDYAEKIGARLIISLDCGIKAIEQVRYARLKELDFIICDHHKPGNELPEALAILDPMRSDCAYPYKYLTGCGVGFKLAQALHPKLQEAGYSCKGIDQSPLDLYGDLLTLSIACDIVPVTGENRSLAYHGLQKIRKNPLKGISAIMAQAKYEREWDISDLVFFIGPRVNAAGRLSHAKEAVEVLLGKNEALKSLAEQLQVSNEERKNMDRETTQEALEMISQDETYLKKSSTVLYHPEWHKGIIGIVASRLIEHHYRPTVMLTRSEEGTLVGSARSVAGFDLYQSLYACKEHILQFGGHAYAAGLSIREEDFPRFSAQFEEEVARTLTPEQKRPILYIDHMLEFPQITDRFIRLINRMAPFGPENEKPVFATRSVKVRHAKILKGEHVKFVLEKDRCMIEAIGFNLAAKWENMGTQFLHIAYQPIFNTWKNKTQINLRLKDIKHPDENI
ncbi:MAG: single-stranded-DNA-specific exonuclease RecJ [Bacteroidia bacterium]|nr:single-stranded-DNA-specific exonuclease RecJ [Bacteroidia bacterium]